MPSIRSAQAMHLWGRLACRVLADVSLAKAATDAAQYSALISGTRGAFGHARPITREIPS
jgi:fructoselysine 6-kinase